MESGMPLHLLKEVTTMKIERPSYQLQEMTVGVGKPQSDTSPPPLPGDHVEVKGTQTTPRHIDASMFGKAAAVESSPETASCQNTEATASINLYSTLTQTSAMVGGPQGTVIAAMCHDELLSSLEALKGKGFTFLKEKSSWVPLLGGKKEISPSGAADILEKGSEKEKGSLFVKGPESCVPPPGEHG